MSSSLDFYRMPNMGSSACPPNLAGIDRFRSSPPSLGLGPSDRSWAVIPSISVSGACPNYSQFFVQQMHSSSAWALAIPQSGSQGGISSTSKSLGVSLVSRGANSRESYSSTAFQIPGFRDSSLTNFPSLSYSSANEPIGSRASYPGLDSIEKFVAMEMRSLCPPPRSPWTMEDRAFQAFHGALRRNMSITPTLPPVASLLSPSTAMDGRALTSDIASPVLVRSNGAPSIAATRIALIDSAVGFWNGAKRALAQIGLEQMDMSSRERLEILDAMAAMQQADRVAFKDQMLASAAEALQKTDRTAFKNKIPAPAATASKFKPSEWFEVRGDQGRPSWSGSTDAIHDFETMIQVNMLIPNLSRLYDLGRPELPRGGIGFVNGIKNTDIEAHASTELLSSFAGGVNVHSVYNASTGFFSDNMKVVLGMKNPSMTRAVLALHKTWNDFFSKAGPNDHFLQFCHSGGATQCKLALESYSLELRKRIEVAAISPATYISSKLCHSVMHYVSTRDFVPKIFSKGRAEIGTVVYLTPHPDVPVWARIAYLDHGINSPTFQDVIKDVIVKFIKRSEKW